MIWSTLVNGPSVIMWEVPLALHVEADMVDVRPRPPHWLLFAAV
jgi:hypothetical protein